MSIFVVALVGSQKNFCAPPIGPAGADDCKKLSFVQCGQHAKSGRFYVKPSVSCWAVFDRKTCYYAECGYLAAVRV